MRNRNDTFSSIRKISILGVLLLLPFPLVSLADSHESPRQNMEANKTTMKDTSRVGDNNIIIFGASYAEGWNPKTLTNYTTLNKGIGGQETSDMLARLQPDVIDNKPEYVIIWGFINDIFRAPDGNFDKAAEGAYNNTLTMLSRLKENSIMPILATEVTILGPDTLKYKFRSLIGKLSGEESYQGRINKRVIAVNSKLKEYTSKHDIMLLDFHQVLSDNDGERKREFAAKDGSHISAAAYAALTNYTESELTHKLKN